MENTNTNLIIKYLAKEDLTSAELEIVAALKQAKPNEFEEIKNAYNQKIFTSLSFDSKIAFQKVAQHLDAQEKSSKIIPLYRQAWLHVAAGILILIAFSFVFAMQYQWQETHFNQTGKLEKVLLPDGSLITLDKNSSLSYWRTALKEFNRDISLSGRAHFEITKNPDKAFVVHSPLVAVTVLGTQFTINQKENTTQIVLHEGKIQLSGEQFSQNVVMDKSGSQIIMDQFGIKKKNWISNTLYTSWMKNKISFQQCSVQEVFDFIEDSYDIQAKVDDPRVLNETLLGSAPSDDPHLILNAIGEILDTKIEINSKN